MNAPHASSEGSDVVSAEQSVVHTEKLVGLETVEREPELQLTVAGPCKNSAGNYVGLSRVQRDALGVTEGATVELFQDGKSLGLYTVGSGSKEFLGQKQLFTANGVNIDTAVTVKKPSAQREAVLSYPVSQVDVTPDDPKILRRRAIIEERFPGVDSDEYVTVPTAVANQLSGGAAKVASISQGTIRFAGKDTSIVLVPTGSGLGLTDKAAQKLGIPESLSEIRLRIDNGVLVVD